MGVNDAKIWPCLKLAVCSILKWTHLFLIAKILLFLFWSASIILLHDILIREAIWSCYCRTGELLIQIIQIMVLSVSLLIVKLGLMPVLSLQRWRAMKCFLFISIIRYYNYILIKLRYIFPSKLSSLAEESKKKTI